MSSLAAALVNDWLSQFAQGADGRYISLRTSPTPRNISSHLSHCLSHRPSTSRKCLQKVCQASGNPIEFRTSLILRTGTAADTWLSTNAWADDIVGEHRNEGSIASNDRSSPISLTSAKTGKEMRKIAAGKKRGTAALGTFEEMFNGSEDR
jgi:hypothetical protein